MFGSTAKGNRLRDSDVDIILVSDEFEKNRYLDRGQDLLKLWYNLIRHEKDVPGLQLICLTSSEFANMKKQEHTLVAEALDHGILL